MNVLFDYILKIEVIKNIKGIEDIIVLTYESVEKNINVDYFIALINVYVEEVGNVNFYFVLIIEEVVIM